MFLGYKTRRGRKQTTKKPHFDLEEIQNARKFDGDESISFKTSSDLFRNVVVEGMKNRDLEESSKQTYHTVWKAFRIFLQGFDSLPEAWEDRMTMYAAHLGNIGTESATVSSYMSAIRYKLRKDGFTINEHSLEIAAIVRTCKKLNDKVILREPIHKHMLRKLLDSVEQHYGNNGQIYLLKLYKAMMSSAYYGFLRIGEITKSKHVINFKDVKLAKNKKSALLILRSSKTHGKGDCPKDIKIPQIVDLQEQNPKHDPFEILEQYKQVRPQGFEQQQFFVFQDGSEVKDFHFRKMFKHMLHITGFDKEVYDCHSLRIGRCHDLLNSGVPLEIVKKWGRWKNESTVMKYFCI